MIRAAAPLAGTSAFQGVRRRDLSLYHFFAARVGSAVWSSKAAKLGKGGVEISPARSSQLSDSHSPIDAFADPDRLFILSPDYIAIIRNRQ
jgi:hypothetical protein